MPIREFLCPIHGKFEKFCGTATYAECPFMIKWHSLGNPDEFIKVPCTKMSPVVEFSVPAKRNPRHGEG
jgi:hypothetical protein